MARAGGTGRQFPPAGEATVSHGWAARPPVGGGGTRAGERQGERRRRHGQGTATRRASGDARWRRACAWSSPGAVPPAVRAPGEAAEARPLLPTRINCAHATPGTGDQACDAAGDPRLRALHGRPHVRRRGPVDAVATGQTSGQSGPGAGYGRAVSGSTPPAPTGGSQRRHVLQPQAPAAGRAPRTQVRLALGVLAAYAGLRGWRAGSRATAASLMPCAASVGRSGPSDAVGRAGRCAPSPSGWTRIPTHTSHRRTVRTGGLGCRAL